MQAKVMTTTIEVGNWVEVRKPRKGRSFLVKGSRYLVEAVNPGREAVKVGNGKDGTEYRTEHLYFDEVSLTSQFVKGDVVQHVEDPRYIGRVIKEGQQVKVKWADGSEDFVRPELINLFTRMVGGEQQIIGQYAFKEGDRVVSDLANFEGLTFKVRECYPSGMVGVTQEEDGLDKSLPGCQLSVISDQQSEPETDWGDLRNWQVGDRASYSDSYGEVYGVVEQVLPTSEKLVILWDGRPLPTDYDPSLIREMGIAPVISNQSSVISNQSSVIPKPPQPENYKTFEEFEPAYDQWVEELWERKGEEADLVQVEEQFTSARELWEQCYPEDEILNLEKISQASEETTPCENFSTLEVTPINPWTTDIETGTRVSWIDPHGSIDVEATTIKVWINPRTVSIDAETQTRYCENEEQIEVYAFKMLIGEWDWEREPLPVLVWDGKFYYIVSGNHRIKAALMASDPNSKVSIQYREMVGLLEPVSSDPIQVYCEIIKGTLEDAKLLAVRSTANNDHGVPESPRDFRNRAEKFLDILEDWDIETQIRELELLKLQPYASKQLLAIDQLLVKLRQGVSGGWSSRIIACYLQNPRASRTISNILNERQCEAAFNKVKSELSPGHFIRFQDQEETRICRVVFISDASMVVEDYLDKTRKTIRDSSPLELLRSIEQVDPIEPAEEESEEVAEEEECTLPPPVKKSGVAGSVSQELKERAESLGLPTSPNQVLPDMSESDRARNVSPFDVDDRPFATPQPMPTPDPKEYLIGFTSNIQNMSQPMIRCALESIFEWMTANGQDRNLGYLKTVINDL